MSRRHVVADEDGVPAQTVIVRSKEEAEPMDWKARAKMQVKGALGGLEDGSDFEFSKEESDKNLAKGRSARQLTQYRLEAAPTTAGQSLFMKLLTCFGTFNCCGPKQTGLVVGANPNKRVTRLLHWMFRINFILLFSIMCAVYFALVIFFCGFITWSGNAQPECIRIGGEAFGASGHQFADAFVLSWTTLSTVGYGNSWPALSSEFPENPTKCFVINLITCIESLIGIMFAGGCGAILFGKILRIQSQAQVVFSDPILVRYGPGLVDKDDEDDEEQASNPCPVMEFRIVNRLYNEQGGEIMDASLNVVANIDADDADPTLSKVFTASVTGSATGSRIITPSVAGSAAGSTTSSIRKSVMRFANSFASSDNHAMDEDPTSKLVRKHIFSKLNIEADSHPFFKRVWLARHTLDADSPILKPRVRAMIKKNGGSWPQHLNSHQAIRDSMNFNQILVSLNGTSNISASDQYSQKIYDFVDVNIGYQFVNVLYRDTDGLLACDVDLINDVREQRGGGGEPLIIEE